MNLFINIKKVITDKIAQKIIKYNYLLQTIVADKTVLKIIVMDDLLLNVILDDVRLAKRIIQNHRCIKAILSDEKILHRILNHQQTFEAILTDRILLIRVLNDRQSLEMILSEKRLMKQILCSTQASEFILGNDELLKYIISNQTTFQILLSDAKLIKTFFRDNRFVALILEDSKALEKIFNDKRSLEMLISDSDLFENFISDNRFIEACSSNFHLLKLISKSEQLTKIIIDNELLVNKFLTAKKVLDRRVSRLNDIIAHPKFGKVLHSDNSHFWKLLNNPSFSDRIASDHSFLAHNEIDSRIKKVNDFKNIWNRLRRFIQPSIQDEEKRLLESHANVYLSGNIAGEILNLICDNNFILLDKGKMNYPDKRSLWSIIEEIFLSEEYYFETETKMPRIIDCGTHFGLSIFYFKSLYPDSKIIGFEPVPKLYEMAKANIEQLKFDNVSLFPYAISDNNGSSNFLISESDSMAGSLTHRRRMMGDTITEIDVQCRILSEFLKKPINFLKLDIEGAEDIVLKEAASRLDNVQQIFCEYHHGSGLPNNRLSSILRILDKSGFISHVGKSVSSHRNSHWRSMSHVKEPYSVSIWAKNMNWKGNKAIKNQ